MTGGRLLFACILIRLQLSPGPSKGYAFERRCEIAFGAMSPCVSAILNRNRFPLWLNYPSIATTGSFMPATDTTNQDHHRLPHTQALDFWLARCAIFVIAMLQLLLVNDFALWSRWLAPAVELLLLVPLSVATAWAQNKAKHASTEAHFHLIAHGRRLIRRAALGLTILVTLMNFVALYFLIKALMTGHAGSAQTLLVDAVNIWCTNIIAFALWFWSIDRGGPASRGVTTKQHPDFLFPQMSMTDPLYRSWSPGFVDYLFVAFTNATAFSPTDTMPLSPRAKLLTMAEAAVSLLTLALVAARAVNILA